MSWFKRNWIWAVPIGCLGAVVSVTGILFACAWLAFALMRQSAVFTDALEAVRDDREVTTALGEPIEPGWWLFGNLHISGPSGSADLMFPISGPRGSGTVYLVAEKEAGEWSFDILEVKLEGREDRIDLLDTDTEWIAIHPRLTRPPGLWYRSAFPPPPPERCDGPGRPPPVQAAAKENEMNVFPIRIRSIASIAPAAALAILLVGFNGTATAAEESDKKPMSKESSPGAAALQTAGRSEDDHKRDEGFKPLEVYGFFGVEPGMTVADLWPGRGYNTHILSGLVGPEGRVLAVLGPLYYQTKYEAYVRPALEKRIESSQLTNVEIVGPLSDVPDNSVDVMITVRNYHDLGDAAERTAVLPELMRILKPGGVLGVVDAVTMKDGVDEPVHRINEELVVKEITAGGFELTERSDVLVNADDTYDFDGREDDAPIHRYFIHRFVHRYEKPKG